MKRLKYHIVTFGCQQNHADSERIAGAFESRNFVKTDILNDLINRK